MTFSKLTTATVALALLTIGLIGAAAVGVAAVDMANEPVTFDDEDNLTVEVDWDDDAATDATADVTIFGEDAYQNDGDTVENYTATLNGTVLEVDDDIIPHATYAAELDASATTVDVDSSAFDDDGTVDLADHTEDTLTEDDDVLSVTVTSVTVVSDTLESDPGNTTDATYSSADGLEDATDYRVQVSADDTEAESVTIDDGTVGGFLTGSDGTPGFGVGVAIVAIATAGVVARARGDL